MTEIECSLLTHINEPGLKIVVIDDNLEPLEIRIIVDNTLKNVNQIKIFTNTKEAVFLTKIEKNIKDALVSNTFIYVCNIPFGSVVEEINNVITKRDEHGEYLATNIIIDKIFQWLKDKEGLELFYYSSSCTCTLSTTELNGNNIHTASINLSETNSVTVDRNKYI